MGSQLKDALKAAGLGKPKRSQPAVNREAAKSNGVRAGDVNTPSTAPRKMPPASDLTGMVSVPGRGIPDAPQRQSSRGVTSGATGSATTAGLPARPSVRPAVPPPDSPPPQQVSTLTRVGEFRPHPLFIDDPSDAPGVPPSSSHGIARQLTTSTDDETDLVIGLDFGTSSTKAVIRDAWAATSVFPVHFDPGRRGIEGYLVPSRVFKTGDVYSLHKGAHHIADLKLALLACDARSPVTEFNDCCAYLALLIRWARGWLLSEHRDIYRRHALNWRINLGLAARSYEDQGTVMLFRRLAWAAANLAADATAQTITTERVDQYRRWSLDVARGTKPGGIEFAWEDVDTVPEVSSQLLGFMTSARWDWQSRPVMMLVDVGAGTVDSALFHVRAPSKGSGVLTFYASRVEQNGVMHLHRQRVSWLRRLLPQAVEHKEASEYLEAIAQPTDRLRPIPESVGDYLPGYRLEVHGSSVDDEFWVNRFRRQVAGTIRDAKVGKGLPTSQLQTIPMLLCGGGSRMHFYSRIGDAINRTAGWHVSVETMRLPVPQDLVDAGWHADDFDRLSVAYGLSLAGQGETTLGRIVRSIEVPDFRPQPSQDHDDVFVSKDQM